MSDQDDTMEYEENTSNNSQKETSIPLGAGLVITANDNESDAEEDDVVHIRRKRSSENRKDQEHTVLKCASLDGASCRSVPTRSNSEEELIHMRHELALANQELDQLRRGRECSALIRPEGRAEGDMNAQRPSMDRMGSRFRRNIVHPSTYDGSIPWIDFITHFDACAEINEWSQDDRAKYLAVTLRGSAQQVLTHVAGGVRASYGDLITALQKRFAPANIEELYKAELRLRQRKSGESLLELGQSIRRLVTLAYPTAPLDVIDTLSKDNFLDALTDPDMRLKVLVGKPQNFDDAIQAAVTLDACQTAESRRLHRPKVRGLGTVQGPGESDTESLCIEMREMMRKWREREEHGQERRNQWEQPGRRPQTKMPVGKQNALCFYCQQPGHYRHECPIVKQDRRKTQIQMT